nr:glutamate receptor 3.6-like [Ipomoea batatas]GMC67490.1 glutamate receptor 3.6-like [Ipomoea batatas]
MFAVFYFGYLPQGVNSTLSARPRVVNIGCILTLRTDIGEIAKSVIETAVEDINSNPAVLGGTKLNITIVDDSNNGLLGIVEAIRYMGTDTVAIIGPQSSVIAHAIAHIANEIHVPLLSFSATDPALSSLQYPFFVRTSPNDMFQMAAIASIVQYYQWEAVIAIYVDDDYGRSGIDALADQLANRRCLISHRAPLKPQATLEEVRDTLAQLALMESRIIVVHTYAHMGLNIFSQAKNLGMIESGFAWIATNWLSTIFDTIGPLSSEVMDNIQGTITLRTYIPDSEAKRKFISRWSNLGRTKSNFGMCTYGLYAYDTVWLLARALDAFFKQGGNVSFSMLQTGLNLYSMNVFDGGKLLVENILKTNISGVTGLFKYTSDRELYRPAFEVINVIGTGTKKVGYWSNYSGLSVVRPDSLYSYPPTHLSSNQKLYPVFWIGETRQTPRGWVFPSSWRQLRVAVSFKAGLNEYVEQVYDAAVGLIGITTNRIKIVDFTPPFIESTLVLVAPFRERGFSTWAFLMPFTPMWCVTGILFLTNGAAIWILEHRMNDDFRGPIRKQIETIICLSSILVAQHPSSLIKGIETLVAKNEPIGYLRGSTARSHLIEELHIQESKLIQFNETEDFAKALRDGPNKKNGVAAVIGYSAYMEPFLSRHCEFVTIGPELSRIGWGFLGTIHSASSPVLLAETPSNSLFFDRHFTEFSFSSTNDRNVWSRAVRELPLEDGSGSDSGLE